MRFLDQICMNKRENSNICENRTQFSWREKIFCGKKFQKEFLISKNCKRIASGGKKKSKNDRKLPKEISKINLWRKKIVKQNSSEKKMYKNNFLCMKIYTKFFVKIKFEENNLL